MRLLLGLRLAAHPKSLSGRCWMMTHPAHTPCESNVLRAIPRRQSQSDLTADRAAHCLNISGWWRNFPVLIQNLGSRVSVSALRAHHCVVLHPVPKLPIALPLPPAKRTLYFQIPVALQSLQRVGRSLHHRWPMTCLVPGRSRSRAPMHLVVYQNTGEDIEIALHHITMQTSLAGHCRRLRQPQAPLCCRCSSGGHAGSVILTTSSTCCHSQRRSHSHTSTELQRIWKGCIQGLELVD